MNKFYYIARQTTHLKEFERRILGGQGETLVWFRLSPRSYLFDLDELVSVLPLRRIVSFPDGGVYRLAASPENGFFRDVALSAYQVNGVRNRRFSGDTSGLRGRIVAWVLRQDGWTDSEWELNMPDGGIVRWSPSCRYSRLGDTFEFRCQDKAFRTSDDSCRPTDSMCRGRSMATWRKANIGSIFLTIDGPPATRGNGELMWLDLYTGCIRGHATFMPTR